MGVHVLLRHALAFGRRVHVEEAFFGVVAFDVVPHHTGEVALDVLIEGVHVADQNENRGRIPGEERREKR